MQACDRYAIERNGVPSSILMENAGRCVADVARDRLQSTGGKDAIIVCGTGRNGGDGFVAARHLVESGVRVRVMLIGRRTGLKGDPRAQFDILRSLSRESGMRDLLDLVVDPTGRSVAAAKQPALIVDALFGIGFRGRLTGGFRKVVAWINLQRVPTISVDIPSGLDADTGRVADVCVRADSTVTMGFLKSGLLIGRGPEMSGEIVTAGLGIPLRTPRCSGGEMFVPQRDDVRTALPRRRFDAHKHSVGKILIFAGSVGYTGAAALTAMSALKSGAGAVILATPASVHSILAKKLTEVMVRPLKDSPDGAFCPESLESVGRELDWADVIIAGPGIGPTRLAGAFIEKLLKTSGKRFVFDADGLSHIAQNNVARGNLRKNRCILTPHAGEFSRLAGLDNTELEEDRLGLARNYVKRNKITLILKGAPTLTVDSDGTAFFNPTGNRGMATAGMGDVLAGIVGALWAETGDTISAAYSGAYLHGEAGDQAMNRLGYRSLMAGDLLNQLPQVFKEYDDN